MKKLIALISAIAVMGSMSLTSLAAITATPAENATLAAVEGGYSAALTTAATNTQTTILAVKGAEITTSSIQYINQLAQDSETAINFDLKDALAVGETVNVYMGGDAIDKTLVGTIANVADPVEKYTVRFFNEDGIEVLGTISEVESGTALVAPAVPPKAADSEYTYEFAGWAVKGDSTLTVVTLPETVTENKEYIAVFTKKPVQSGGESAYTVSGTVSNYASTEFFESEDIVDELADIYDGDEEGYEAEMQRLKDAYAISAYLYEKADLEAYANYYIGETEEAPTALATAAVSPDDGTFTFTDVSDGDYLLVVGRSGIIPYLDYVTVDGSDCAVDGEIELIYGDIPGSSCDGCTTFVDARLIYSQTNYVGEEEFDPTYDVNLDAARTFVDAREVYNNQSDIYAYDTEATADLEELELI